MCRDTICLWLVKLQQIKWYNFQSLAHILLIQSEIWVEYLISSHMAYGCISMKFEKIKNKKKVSFLTPVSWQWQNLFDMQWILDDGPVWFDIFFTFTEFGNSKPKKYLNKTETLCMHFKWFRVINETFAINENLFNFWIFIVYWYSLELNVRRWLCTVFYIKNVSYHCCTTKKDRLFIL